ncbi:MAG: helix-turn-helix domain-containing protein [Thermoguttaceae bacterium]|nr:helix-turn-helix domain-containing protein [Thermoguttaceae bacterium]
MSEFLTIDDVADLLKCSVRTVNYLRTNSGLPCVKLGRLVRFSREAVEAWLAEKQKAASGVKCLENHNEKEA